MYKINYLILAVLMTTAFSGQVVAADGKQVYDFYCAQCHGAEGDGKGPNITEDFATSPRNFTESAEMAKLTDADIKNIVLDGGPAVGKSELMPAWSKSLTTDEVDALVVELRKFCNCKGA